MVDLAKRKTLITLGGTALVTAAPTLAGAGVLSDGLNSDNLTRHSTQSVLSITPEGKEISLSLLVDEESVLTISNHTDQLIIVRHVYPGIVHAGKQTFDITSVFERSAYAIGAGRSRSMPIKQTFSTQAETDFPRHRYSNKPIRVAALLAQSSQGKLVANSSRSFFA